MTNTEKLKQAIDIIAGLNARVDQANTIVIPAINAINLIADVRNSLKAEEEKEKRKEE